MKATDHRRILKNVVTKKDKQLHAVQNLLTEERDFWLNESGIAGDKLSDAVELLTLAKDYILDDETTAKIDKFLDTVYQ
jgi:hypothetical protein